MGAATAPTLPIFKVFQFPADQIPRIDGKDDDWAMVPDSYAITLADMHDDQHNHAAPDPKDLDIKVKVGWVKGLNRLYFLYEAYDNYWDFADPGLHNDTFEVVVDGDRSGGPLIPRFRNNTDQNEWDAHFSMHGVQAQNYHIFTPSEGKDWAHGLGLPAVGQGAPLGQPRPELQLPPGSVRPLHPGVLHHAVRLRRLRRPAARRRIGALREQAHRPVLGRHRLRRRRPTARTTASGTSRREHTMYGNSTYLREFRLMPLEPQFRKPIEAKWSFKVVDMDRRLVAFQDESEGTITSWQWDFGDGTDSSDQYPIHKYKDAGEYVVVLYVEGPAGKSRLSKIWDVTLR